MKLTLFVLVFGLMLAGMAFAAIDMFSIGSPNNGANLSDSTPLFTASVRSTTDLTFECNFSIVGGSVFFNDLAAGNMSVLSQEYALGTLADGNYDWNISCADSEGVQSTTQSFTVDTTAPTVNLMTPANQTYTSNTSIDHYFNFTDNNIYEVANCTLYLDGGTNSGNSSTVNNTATNISTTGGSEMVHTWYVECIDPAGNAANSSTWTYTIDTTEPTVNLTSPVNNTMRSGATYSMSFDFNYTDDLSSTANCSLMISGVSEGNNETVDNATNTEFNVSGIASGLRPWYVTCTDLAGNAANSITYYLNGTGVPSSSGSGSSSGSSSRSLSVSVDSSCNNNTITTNVGSVSVNVLDENTGAAVYSGTTDSDGNAIFNSCGRVVRVYANKDGYRSTDSMFTLDSCSCLGSTEPAPVVAPSVVVPPTPPVTPPVPPVVTPTNTTPPTPTTNETVPPVVAPTTPVVPTFTGPTTGRVGESSTFEVGSCPDCTVRVESPDGRTTTLTPTSGRITLPLPLSGTYRLSLLRSGEVVKSLSVGATAPVAPSPTPAPSVPTPSSDNGMGFALMILVLLVIVGGVAYYLMSRKK